MTPVRTNPSAVGILALSLALVALAAPASGSAAQQPAPAAPTTAPPCGSPAAGTCPDPWRSPPGITTSPSPRTPRLLYAASTAQQVSPRSPSIPRHPHGSDLELAYLTIGGGGAALTLIGFGGTLAADRLRGQRTRRSRSTS